MQYNRYLALVVGPFICAFPFVSTPACHANLIFDVSLDTSPLIGTFFVDFQLIDGTGIGDNNNMVNLSKFDLNGGIPPISPITLEDTAFFNEALRFFIPGSSLSFRVNLTTNVDAGLTPDAFSFAILDFNLTPLPTTGLGDAFLLVNINSSTPLIENFPTSPGSAFQLPAPEISAVPETGSSISMLLIGLGAVWWFRRRFLRLA